MADNQERRLKKKLKMELYEESYLMEYNETYSIDLIHTKIQYKKKSVKLQNF